MEAEYRRHIEAYPNIIDEVWPHKENRRILQAVFDEVTAESRVLDVGCNSGWLLQRLRDEKGCDVIGVEPALKPLEAAKERLNGCIVKAFGEHLPFKDEAFDVTIGCTLLQQVADIEPVVRELERVTRRGGAILGVNPQPYGRWGNTALDVNLYVSQVISADWMDRAFGLASKQNIGEDNYLWKMVKGSLSCHASRLPLAVVIPVHKCLNYTTEAVKSFIYPGEYQIILIDNAADEETEKWAKETDRPVGYLPQTENLGAARSWNLGIRTAFELGYSYVLVANNDLVFAPDAVRNLVPSAYDGFATVHSIGPHPELLESAERKNERSVADFCGFVITRNIWKTVGPFDERYWPAYVEDKDFDERLAKAGIQRYSCLDALVAHYGSRTRIEGGVDTTKYGRANREIFAKTYGYWPASGKPYEGQT